MSTPISLDTATAPRPSGAGQPRPGCGPAGASSLRIVIAIDPGARSGVAMTVVCDSAPYVVREMDLAKFSEESAGAELSAMIDAAPGVPGALRSWYVILEKPFSPRGPIAARSFWGRVILALAKARAKAAGQRYRRPLVLDPRPTEWRAGLGLQQPTAKRDLCKAEAIRWLKLVTGIEAGPDAAEAACMSLWGERVARMGTWHHRRGPRKRKGGKVTLPPPPPVPITFVP